MIQIPISKKLIEKLLKTNKDITCPLCKAEFNDEIYYMLRGNSEFKYCPRCGERIYNEVTEN